MSDRIHNDGREEPVLWKDHLISADENKIIQPSAGRTFSEATSVYDHELNETFEHDPNASTEQVSFAMGGIAKRLIEWNQLLEHSLKSDPDCFCPACNLQRQIEKLTEIRTMQNERALAQLDNLLATAENVCKQRELDKFKLPGIGNFTYRKLPDKLDISQYDAMSNDEKAALHSDCPNLFAIKSTVAPDKKAIKEVLTTGNADEKLNERVNATFSISVGEKVFKFKEE